MTDILVLEDDELLSKQISWQLANAGYDVVTFRDARPALAHLEEHNVDLVIADLFIKSEGKFASEGGLTVISHLRQIERRETPVIAISGSFDGAHGEHARSSAETLGATANLAKPFHPDALLKLVQDQLKRKSTS